MSALSGVYQIPKSIVTILAVLATFLLCVDGALLTQNRKLKAMVASQIPTLAVAVGAVVPPIDGIDTSGSQSTVEYGKDPRETVVFVFSTECSICTKNWPTWEALARHINANSYRVVYANLSKGVGRDYLAAHNLLDSKVFSQLDPKVTVAYNLALTPQVLLISPQGRVERVWLGLLKGEKLSELERTLGVSNLFADRAK